MTSSVTITDRGMGVYPPGHTTQASPNVDTLQRRTTPTSNLNKWGTSKVLACTDVFIFIDAYGSEKDILNSKKMSQSSLKFSVICYIILNGHRRPRQQIY